MTTYLSLEIRRALRDKRYVLLVIGWPVAAYLLFSTVFASAADAAEGLPSSIAIMVAMACFGAIGGVLMASGPRLALDRQSGWLRQLTLTPLSRRGILSARLLSSMALSLPAIALTFAVAAVVRGVHLEWWQWAAMLAVIAVGCLPFAVLGLIVGALGDGDSAAGLAAALNLVLAALGGLWMPVAILPAPMKTIAHILPSNHLAQLGWALARGSVPAASDALILAAYLAGAILIATIAARRLAVRG